MLTFGREMIARAQARADKMGVLRNSLTKGEGNLVGMLGEECVIEFARQHGICLSLVDTYEYDLKAPNNLRIEVKSTERNVAPRSFFDNGITRGLHLEVQNTDVFVFVTVVLNATRTGGVCYFCGMIDRDRFVRECKVQRAGEKRADTKFVARATQRYVTIEACDGLCEFLYRIQSDTK